MSFPDDTNNSIRTSLFSGQTAQTIVRFDRLGRSPIAFYATVGGNEPTLTIFDNTLRRRIYSMVYVVVQPSFQTVPVFVDFDAQYYTSTQVRNAVFFWVKANLSYWNSIKVNDRRAPLDVISAINELPNFGRLSPQI